jgi:hypothetical protein
LTREGATKVGGSTRRRRARNTIAIFSRSVVDANRYALESHTTCPVLVTMTITGDGDVDRPRGPEAVVSRGLREICSASRRSTCSHRPAPSERLPEQQAARRRERA